MAGRPVDETTKGSLRDVVGVALEVSPKVDLVMIQADAGQEFLRSHEVSDRSEVTRSTALWALMTVDSGVREALDAAGLDADTWAQTLGFSGPPPTGGSPDPPIEEDFRRALVDFLESSQAVGSFGPVDMARAIVQSVDGVTRDATGLVGTRLGDLGADPRKLDGALLASQFSRSVRAVRDEVDPKQAVTASEIAEKLQRSHGEYGKGLFAGVELATASSESVARGFDEWLALVRGLYDTGAVETTDHQVLNGELLLLGLEVLDLPLSRALAANGCLDALEAGVAIQPQRSSKRTLRDGTPWTSDDVADRDCEELRDSDYLGRRFLAKALAVRLRSLWQTPETFIVHVDGPWGSGKSTLFKLLKCELTKDDSVDVPKDDSVDVPKDYLVVEVNAWRDQQVGVQWWTLHNALRRSVVDSAKSPTLETVHLWFGAIRTRLAPFLAGLAVIAGVILGGALLANWDLTTGGNVADSIGKIVTLAGVGFAALMALYRYLLPASGRSAQAFVENSSNPMEEVQRLFERTLRRAKKPVVFLVDDLDRCEQAYVLEFLEVVQTLVRPALRGSPSGGEFFPGPYAFIAADGQWLRASYEAHFNDSRVVPVPGRTLGYLFLEKIFQLQVRLPSVSDEAKTAYYESLLRVRPNSSHPTRDDERRGQAAEARVDEAVTGEDINEAAQEARGIQDHNLRTSILGKAAVRLSEQAVTETTRHELSQFAPLLEANPRSIKLFVNSFGMQQTLRTLEGTRVSTTPLALWTIVEIRWPLLADHLRRYPDHIELGLAAGAPPDEIRQLLESPDVQRVIKNVHWEGLTPEIVRQCTGELA
jgi:hypothetical protein